MESVNEVNGDGVVEGFMNEALEQDGLRDQFAYKVDEAKLQEGKIAIATFLKGATCYDLLPESGKVVMFDAVIPLRYAYYAMVEHGTDAEAVNDIGHLATPVWSASKQCLVGIITVREIIQILRYGYKTGTLKEIFDHHTIASWWQLIKQLKESPELEPDLVRQQVVGVKAAAMAANAERENDKQRNIKNSDGSALCVEPDCTLYDACRQLRAHGVRWIPILDTSELTCLGVVTHLVILKYLVHKFREERRLFDQSIRDLGIGTFRTNGKKVISVKLDTLLCDVIDILVGNKISCVPIVDDNGRPIEVYSTTNVTTPIAKSSIDTCMTKPVSYFLFTDCANRDGNPRDTLAKTHHKSEFHTCVTTNTLHEVFVQFADTQVPRLICVDEDGQLDGVISVSDLLPFFLDEAYRNTPPEN